MTSDGPAPLASRSQKFLGGAEYSGPSRSLCPGYEATACCKQGSSCVLTLLLSKETGYLGSDASLSLKCSLDAVWTRAGLGAPLHQAFSGPLRRCEWARGL